MSLKDEAIRFRKVRRHFIEDFDSKTLDEFLECVELIEKGELRKIELYKALIERGIKVSQTTLQNVLRDPNVLERCRNRSKSNQGARKTRKTPRGGDRKS